MNKKPAVVGAWGIRRAKDPSGDARFAEHQQVPLSSADKEELLKE